MDEMFGLFANVTSPDRCLRLGAKVRVLSVPGDPSKAKVRGMSRGGRPVTKWVLTKKRLGNFRIQWVRHHGRNTAGLWWPARSLGESYVLSRRLGLADPPAPPTEADIRQSLADVLAMRGRVLLAWQPPPDGRKWWTRPSYYIAYSGGGDWGCAFCDRPYLPIATRVVGHVCSCGAVLMPDWSQRGLVDAHYDQVEIYA